MPLPASHQGSISLNINGPGPVITHYALSLRLSGLIIPLGPLAAGRQTILIRLLVLSCFSIQVVAKATTPLQYGLQPLHSSLPGAVSARLLNPAILCRIPSITACLRVSKKLSCRTTTSSVGKWHARTTSHAAPSTCQNSRKLLDAARRMRDLFLTLSRKPLVLSPLPRQQSEEPEPEPEAVSERRLKSGVLLRRHLLRS